MNLLFLDDMKVRHDAFHRNHIGHNIVHVETAAQAKAALDETVFDIAFLDHDLAEEHYLTLSGGLREHRLPGEDEYDCGTGMDVVKHIVCMPEGKKPKKVIVHSFNPIAAEMVDRLRVAGLWAAWLRFDAHARYA